MQYSINYSHHVVYYILMTLFYNCKVGPLTAFTRFTPTLSPNSGNHLPLLCEFYFFPVVLDCMYKWDHMVFVFLWLISLSVIPSSPIHVVANSKILFFHGWKIFLCVHILYPHFHWWTLRLLPYLQGTLGCQYPFELGCVSFREIPEVAVTGSRGRGRGQEEWK